MAEIRELTDEIVMWADEVFPQRTTSSALLKFFEEVGELVKDPTKGDEYADISIMLFDLARMNGVDLADAIRKKMAINRERNWEILPTGVMRHTEMPVPSMDGYYRDYHDLMRQAYDEGVRHAAEGMAIRKWVNLKCPQTEHTGTYRNGTDAYAFYERGFYSCTEQKEKD